MGDSRLTVRGRLIHLVTFASAVSNFVSDQNSRWYYNTKLTARLG